MQDGRANEVVIETLVTGGNGFIGRWLLATLTARGEHVAVPMRDAARRGDDLRRFVASLGGDPDRLHLMEGDVERPHLGMLPADGDRLGTVRDVYHLAARFAFGLGMDEARRANVDGTRHVLLWSAARPTLRRFVLLGGYRMTVTPAAVLDAPYDPGSWAARYRTHGAYETSKHEAYALTRDFVRTHGIPYTGVHPSTVIGDARTGLTIQRTGLAETLERLHAGSLPALVGTEDTFVPVVTVDYLASFLASVPPSPESVGQDLVVLDDETPTLPTLIRHAARYLGVAPPRLRVPVGVVSALPAAITGVEPETLRFLSEERYDTMSARAHAARAHLAMPDVTVALERWCDELVSTRFVTEPDAPRGSLRDGLFTVGDPRDADFVLLHGLPWNGDVFEALAPQLGGSHARIDLPGLGRSPLLEEEPEARWLERALGDRQRGAVLVAHSFAARDAVMTAQRAPHLVGHLVLVAPGFLLPRARASLRIRPLVARVLARSSPEALRARLLPADERGDIPHALESAARDLRRPGVARRTADALALASRLDERARLREALGALQVPVTVVVGSRDPLETRPARGEVRVIDDAGHVPQLTHPDALATLLNALGPRREAGRPMTASGSISGR